MADTKDVAKVLFEWLFNKTYEEAVMLSGGTEYVNSVITRLEQLVEVCHISIEDVEMRLRWYEHNKSWEQE